MIPLILLDELTNYRSRDLIPLSCKQCQQLFYWPKNRIQAILKGIDSTTGDFCSKECQNKSQIRTQISLCLTCNSTIQDKQSNRRLFCSKSCAARYNNQHKTHGTRRAKLESCIELQLKNQYPNLLCLYNNKEIIGSELDFYFPTLKLAIELNGIYHYEPIHGIDKLTSIQNNDTQKIQTCITQNIKLYILDTSKDKNLNQTTKDKYWQQVKDILDTVL